MFGAIQIAHEGSVLPEYRVMYSAITIDSVVVRVMPLPRDLALESAIAEDFIQNGPDVMGFPPG